MYQDQEIDINISNGFRRIAFSIIRVIVKIFFNVKVTGSISSGSKVFAANHISYFDAFVIIGSLSKKELNTLLFTSKDKYTRFLGPLSERGGLLSFGKNSKRTLSQAVTGLRRGLSLLIFPEGTRSKKMMRFRRAFTLLARESDVPIVPIALKRKGLRYNISFLEPTFNYDEDYVKSLIEEELAKW